MSFQCTASFLEICPKIGVIVIKRKIMKIEVIEF